MYFFIHPDLRYQHAAAALANGLMKDFGVIFEGTERGSIGC